MDWQAITSLISSVGFPIVCCIVLFYQNNKQNELHVSEVNKMVEAITNNTKAIELLKEQLSNGTNKR